MKSHSVNGTRRSKDDYLNVFCCLEGDCWRVHAVPIELPNYLLHCFDRDGEAFPAFLDFEDLHRYMIGGGYAYEKHVAKTGGVELTAHGAAATALGHWLMSCFGSGIRGDIEQKSNRSAS